MNVAQEVNLLIERCPPDQYLELHNELGRALIKLTSCMAYADPAQAEHVANQVCKDIYRAARVK